MLPSSCLFEVTGDTASGHWYLHEHTRDLQGNASTALSCYRDTYVKRGGQWLYRSRDYQPLYHGPADLSGSYTPPA